MGSIVNPLFYGMSPSVWIINTPESKIESIVQLMLLGTSDVFIILRSGSWDINVQLIRNGTRQEMKYLMV